jgi:ubiquinone/menaquinone biosynthesis C-methylase UbiE
VLDYPAASFDRVFSSFMFHHLARDEKERTPRAIWRVPKDGGSLHLLDFGGPDSVGTGHACVVFMRTTDLPRPHAGQA